MLLSEGAGDCQPRNLTDKKLFDYDLAGRLKASNWSRSSGNPLNSANENIEYDYDIVGNRTVRRQKTSGNTNVWDYTLDYTNNQLDFIHKNSIQTHAYAYKNTGQVENDGSLTMAYNRAQRLVSVTQSGQLKGKYVYNSGGQRVKKQAGGAITHFHYDLQGQLLAETDETGALIREYVYLGSQPVAMMGGEKLYQAVESTSSVLVGQNDVWINSNRNVEHQSLQVTSGNTEISGNISDFSSKYGKEYAGLTIREQPDGLSGVKVDVYLSAVNESILNMINVQKTHISCVAKHPTDVCQERTIKTTIPIPMFGTKTVDEVLEYNITYSDGTTNQKTLERSGDHLKLERVDQFVRIYTSIDGTTWTLLEEISVPMTDSAYMGVIASNTRANVDTKYVTANDNLFYLHADYLNSVYAVSSNSSKNKVWQRRDFELGASPFGDSKLVNGQPMFDGSFEMPLRFPGQYFDGESGLNYNYFRYYYPGTGRYISSDPIGLDGGVNTYGYVYNNPLSLIDPLGLVNLEIPGTVGDTTVHANPGPNATTYRAEHGPAHIHLGSNKGPRVSIINFKPWSEDSHKMIDTQMKFFKNLSNSEKNLIRRRAKAVFKNGSFGPKPLSSGRGGKGSGGSGGGGRGGQCIKAMGCNNPFSLN